MKTNNRPQGPSPHTRTLAEVGVDLSLTIDALTHTFANLTHQLADPCADRPDLHVQASQIMARARRLVAENATRVAHLEKLVVTDELTGLFNRRGFLHECDRTLASARRYDEHGVLIYIDLDGFKPVNDRFGHAAGDRVLIQVAKLLVASVRRTDFVGRLGGDEFAVMLVRTGWDDGAGRAKRLETLLKNLSIPWGDLTITLGASCGVRAYDRDSQLNSLLHSADNAMFRAKTRSVRSAFPRIPANPKPPTANCALDFSAAPPQRAHAFTKLQ